MTMTKVAICDRCGLETEGSISHMGWALLNVTIYKPIGEHTYKGAMHFCTVCCSDFSNFLEEKEKERTNE